jgi:hypothetical protein
LRQGQQSKLEIAREATLPSSFQGINVAIEGAEDAGDGASPR